MSAGRSFSLGRLAAGLLIAAGAHVLIVGGAFLAGRIIEPTEGGGMDDLAAIASILVIGEIAVFFAALIGAIVLMVKRRFDWAVGTFFGWLAGPIFLLTVAAAQSGSQY
jgi:hypothetical protein